MKLLVLLSIALTLASSCKEKVAVAVEQTTDSRLSADLQNYENEVMKIHDEAMPKMSEIKRLSSQLIEIKAEAAETPEGKPVEIEGLDDTLESLRQAEEGMMTWMNNYSNAKARVTPELLKTFYERELEKITQVKMNMLNSIEKANTWLANHPAG